MKNIFHKEIVNEIESRIHGLQPKQQATWGKMSVAQMLAHCNVTYELVYENKHPKPNAFVKTMLKWFVKNTVVSESPYKQGSPTAAVFIIKDEKEFDVEKKRLINHIHKTQTLGESHFEKKESHSFGVLSTTEWNNMFYKHLDHHLTQFGV